LWPATRRSSFAKHIGYRLNKILQEQLLNLQRINVHLTPLTLVVTPLTLVGVAADRKLTH
jgi:hypothetical protein